MQFFSAIILCLLSVATVWTLPITNEHGNKEANDSAMVKMFNYINNHRVQKNLPTLIMEPCLYYVAYRRSKELDTVPKLTYCVANSLKLAPNECDAKIPRDTSLIQWIKLVNTDTFESKAQEENFINYIEMPTSEYIGLDVISDSDEGQAWTIILA
ncbi:hypothetical protein BDF19DRAFT_438134 [Syncephalis fuscata]|nr:hypothetical protein BDF19DRAFT_438134 [Syncephalis fuscata]